MNSESTGWVHVKSNIVEAWAALDLLSLWLYLMHSIVDQNKQQFLCLYISISKLVCLIFCENTNLILMSCFLAADLFTDLENALQEKIDAAYFETSKYLLDVLNKKYNLLEHMQAMRRYLLLGQGDFIRHLMDLLK